MCTDLIVSSTDPRVNTGIGIYNLTIGCFYANL